MSQPARPGTPAFSRWAGLVKINPRFLANRNRTGC
jgi:hypothetical protein